jgi:hypothetical protein
LRPLAYALAALFALAPGLALAAEDVASASAAFAEAQKAQLRGDYSRAAEMFELADQSAPSPAALRSAIRNRDVAGQEVRAATLSLRALERYPDDKDTREVAQTVLARLAPKLVKVRASCSEPCRLTVDGGLVVSEPVSTRDFFVAAGKHTVEAQWRDRPTVSRSVEGAAGSEQTLVIEAPPPKPEAAAAPPPRSDAPQAAAQPASPSRSATLDAKSDSGGLSPAVFWIGTGLTVVAGGLLTWSSLDTLDAADAYEKNPSQAGYDDGVELEQRTNILAGATAVLGVTTIAIGLFATDWDGSGQAGAEISKNGVAFSYRGHLP